MRQDSQNLLDYVDQLIKGDTPGHPFRGNQHTSGEGSADSGSSSPKPGMKLDPKFATHYKRGDKVKASFTVQGMKMGNEYTVTRVAAMESPFGTFVNYELDGKFWIGNAEFITTKVERK